MAGFTTAETIAGEWGRGGDGGGGSCRGPFLTFEELALFVFVQFSIFLSINAIVADQTLLGSGTTAQKNSALIAT